MESRGIPKSIADWKEYANDMFAIISDFFAIGFGIALGACTVYSLFIALWNGSF